MPETKAARGKSYRARWLIAPLALGLCLAGGAARSAVTDLRADPRLSARLTLAEPMITVRGLLARVRSECQVELEADPALRSETVCVCVKDQQCGEVLAQLAEALEYRWARSTSTSKVPFYRLTEDDGVRLRRARLARQYRREVSQELVTQLGLLERFARRFGELDARGARDELQRLEAVVNALPTSPERFQAELEYAAAEQCTEPESRPLLLALQALPPPARERLIDGERLVMATRRPGALPMPAELLRALQEARQALARDQATPVPGHISPLTDDEAIDFICQVSWGELTVYVRARGVPGRPERLFFAIPTFLQTPSFVAYGPKPSDLIPGTVTADRPEPLQTPVVFRWPGKKLQVDRPLSYHTGVTVAEVLGSLAATDPRWQVSGSALLEGIPTVTLKEAAGGGAPGGAESAAMLLSRLTEKSRAGALSLGELLAVLAERGGVNFHLGDHGWIRFQSTRPFRARERQVDPLVLKEVFGPVVEAKEMTPEAAMLAGRLLSRTQLETLSAPYLGFPRHLTQNSGLRSVIDAWRLLDGLSVSDRTALFAGTVVQYSRLSESGKGAVRRYLREVSARPNGAPLDLELDSRDLPGLRLALSPGSGSLRNLELRFGREGVSLYAAHLEADWPAEH